MENIKLDYKMMNVRAKFFKRRSLTFLTLKSLKNFALSNHTLTTIGGDLRIHRVLGIGPKQNNK